MDTSKYLEIFIEETKEHLLELNQSLLQLEQNPGDNSMLDSIFRVAHTLKGMASTMGFNNMSHLTHDMENVLQALKNNEIQISTTLIDLLFKCLDALENYLNCIIENGNEGNNDYREIIYELNNLLNGSASSKNINAKPVTNIGTYKTEPQTVKEHPTANMKISQYERNVINKALSMDMNVFKVTVVLDKGCLLKSARTFIVFQTLEKYSEIIKSVPSVEDLEDEKFDFEFSVIVITKENADLLEKELNSISEIEEVIITQIDSSSIEDKAESDSKEADEEGQDILNAVANIIKEKSEAEDEAAATSVTSRKAKTGKTVRVDIERLDVLLNLVSELIIQKTRLEGIDVGKKSQTFTETVEYLERITTSLHDAVMKVRMVPVEAVFNRFPRMIRDLSKELGKQVILTMSGEETELDRTVIDEIGDPLIHILRNSIDHGIEPLEKRRELGKPDAGRIYLRAYQDGSNVVIEVEDDGQGIDIEKVKKKAIEKELLNKELANSLSEEEILDFLFRPSFSTAEKVTDLSGRGVGLDVVKTKIEALGGTVELETEYGKGTRFIIRLPLTLAIIQALLVMVGDEKYAIQLSSINQIINILPEEIKLVQDQEVILYRNKVIPIIRLDKVLNVVKKEDKPKKKLTVVVVKKGDKLSGLLVDSIIGQQEIVQKSLGKFLSGIKVITSATILGDGNVALILDVNYLT
ncbi:MAG TPA: chemotaxis protein CheA [Clostridiaceae bacterium]|nr:chemotaxis protein CheA [Clostridiaceae bacterium]